MARMFDLDRFMQAQQPVIAEVERELAAGAKRSHWMWFVFPQLRGLGHSATARHYGLDGAAEAEAFLRHPVLGARLLSCTDLVNAVPDRTASQVFGYPDDLKFHSCMTLFGTLADAPACFDMALSRFFDRQPDPNTLRMLRG